ncbi:MAG TPA: DegT/DnrJ/EryC1/StrS family aminotransferase [Thermoanaerobaculia bacterium]|nr:DegT/DnrJ/EryC1/StrS family aminotransferase [Thermoanaerobaculia bacterium]
MPIPLLDLKRQYQTIREDVLRVTEEVYEAQAFILGKRVEDFERDFAAYCHASHAIGVSSGTDALLVALMVLDIQPGDEVIVPAYSFFATAGVVERIGAIPVFADIEPESFNIDPREIEKHLTSRTKAIIPVHLYGQLADMDAIVGIASSNGAAVVEDSAQAVGAEMDGRRTGALGIMACFSFFPSKNLGAFGDAGAVTTNDDQLAARLVDYRVHGMRPKYFHHSVGGNFRIDALQAAILHIKLAYLDQWTDGRRRNAAIYRSAFQAAGTGERVVLPVELPSRRHVYNQFVIRFPDGRDVRDSVMGRLKDAGIGCEIYYPLPLPKQKCFRDLPGAKESYPHSEAAADQSLAIPIYPELTEPQIGEVVDTIASALDR